MGGFISSIASFFGGGISSSIVAAMALCLLAALGLSECRQGKIERLTADNRELLLASQSNARAAATERRERLRLEQTLNSLETDREENRKQVAAVQSEAARVDQDWRSLPLPAGARALPGRLFRKQTAAAGGNGAGAAARRLAAQPGAAGLAGEHQRRIAGLHGQAGSRAAGVPDQAQGAAGLGRRSE